jgi:hypothetical protein
MDLALGTTEGTVPSAAERSPGVTRTDQGPICARSRVFADCSYFGATSKKGDTDEHHGDHSDRRCSDRRLAAVAFVARRRRARQLDMKRDEAREHREQADTSGRKAEHARLAAEEHAERARKEQAAAEEHRQQAREIDPDVEK